MDFCSLKLHTDDITLNINLKCLWDLYIYICVCCVPYFCKVSMPTNMVFGSVLNVTIFYGINRNCMPHVDLLCICYFKMWCEPLRQRQKATSTNSKQYGSLVYMFRKAHLSHCIQFGKNKPYSQSKRNLYIWFGLCNTATVCNTVFLTYFFAHRAYVLLQCIIERIYSLFFRRIQRERANAFRGKWFHRDLQLPHISIWLQ